MSPTQTFLIRKVYLPNIGMVVALLLPPWGGRGGSNAKKTVVARRATKQSLNRVGDSSTVAFVLALTLPSQLQCALFTCSPRSCPPKPPPHPPTPPNHRIAQWGPRGNIMHMFHITCLAVLTVTVTLVCFAVHHCLHAPCDPATHTSQAPTHPPAPPNHRIAQWDSRCNDTHMFHAAL